MHEEAEEVNVSDLLEALTPTEVAVMYYALRGLTPDDPAHAFLSSEISYEGVLLRLWLEERVNEITT